VSKIFFFQHLTEAHSAGARSERVESAYKRLTGTHRALQRVVVAQSNPKDLAGGRVFIVGMAIDETPTIGSGEGPASVSRARRLVDITLQEMLHDRSYHTIVKTPTGFEAQCPSGRVHAVVLEDEKLSIKTLRGMLTSSDNWKLIIVCMLGPTSFTRREIQEKQYNVELFSAEDCLINVSRHKYTPRMRKLTESEKVSLFASLGSADGSAFPKMLRADPVCRYYDFRKGDVIHISRTTGYQEMGDYYRIVSETA